MRPISLRKSVVYFLQWQVGDFIPTKDFDWLEGHVRESQG